MPLSFSSFTSPIARGTVFLAVSLLVATVLAACMTHAESRAAETCGIDPGDPMCRYWTEVVQEERAREAERRDFQDSMDEPVSRDDTEERRLEAQWEAMVAEAVAGPADATTDPELTPFDGAWCSQAAPNNIWGGYIIEITGEKSLAVTERRTAPGLGGEMVMKPHTYGFIVELKDDGSYELQPHGQRPPDQPEGVNYRMRSEAPGVLTYIRPGRDDRTLVPCRPRGA